MKQLLCAFCISASLCAQVHAVQAVAVVARDTSTGQIGVAVISHSFAIGQLVPWAEAGVGAVATQGRLDPSYGPEGLYLLRNGKTALDSMRALIAADEEVPGRSQW